MYRTSIDSFRLFARYAIGQLISGRESLAHGPANCSRPLDATPGAQTRVAYDCGDGLVFNALTLRDAVLLVKGGATER